LAVSYDSEMASVEQYWSGARFHRFSELAEDGWNDWLTSASAIRREDWRARLHGRGDGLELSCGGTVFHSILRVYDAKQASHSKAFDQHLHGRVEPREWIEWGDVLNIEGDHSIRFALQHRKCKHEVESTP
jgi:hypothetical protein